MHEQMTSESGGAMQQAPRTIDVAPNGILRQAIEELVVVKDQLDRLPGRLGRVLAHKLGMGEGTMGPWSFACTVLPFLSDSSEVAARFPALVPALVTIGESCRWTDHPPGHSDRDASEAFYTDPARATTGAHEGALYTWVRELGLFIAHEGKNRVRFLRDRGVQYIPAEVSPHAYPAADRITIYSVTVHGRIEHVAVLDGQRLRRVAVPALTLPVMRAYDVQHERCWPEQWPALEVVLRELDETNWRALANHEVDLARLIEREARQHEIVHASVSELAGVYFDPRQRRLLVGTGVASAIMVAVGTPWLTIAGLGGLGIVIGVGLGVSGRWLKVPRCRLDL